MTVQDFLSLEPVHLDPDQQVALKGREDSDADGIVKEVG
jgi:hypothetical protein